MLELVPPKPPHQESVHKALLGSVYSSNIIDQLDLTVLFNDVNGGNASGSAKRAPIRQLNLGCVFSFGRSVFHHVTHVRIEDVEYELSPRFQMAMNALKRCDLIACCNQMLEWTKWYHYDTKSLPQIERSHIRLHQIDSRSHFCRVTRYPLATSREHANRVIDPRDLLASARKWKQNAAGSAAQLENAAVYSKCFFDVEIDVAPLAVQRNVVVQLAYFVDIIVIGDRVGHTQE